MVNKFLSVLKFRVSSFPFIIPLLLFLLVQAFLYNRFGVFTGLEALKYIDEGNLLYEEGRLSAPKYIFYLPVILLVYLSKFLSFSLGFVVLCQVLISLLALYYFFKLISNLNDKKNAVFVTSIIASFAPLYTWNFYIYSDSLFISLCTIFCYIVFKYGNRGIIGILIILVGLILLILARPHGMLFIPVIIIYILFLKTINVIQKLLVCSVLMILMYFTLTYAFTGGADMDAMKPFIEEHVICFVPLKPEGANLNLIITGNPLQEMFNYIINNPVHFLKLMGLKLISFFNLTRPYHSSPHNLYLLAYLVPLYLFFLHSILIIKKPYSHFEIFLLATILLYPLGATFQCNDWHGRFTFPIIVIILIFCIFRSNDNQKLNFNNCNKGKLTF